MNIECVDYHTYQNLLKRSDLDHISLRCDTIELTVHEIFDDFKSLVPHLKTHISQDILEECLKSSIEIADKINDLNAQLSHKVTLMKKIFFGNLD